MKKNNKKYGKKKKYIVWTDKHRRCFHRIKLGIRKHRNEILRFLTLSVAPNSKKELLPAFHDLHRRIKRLTVNSLIRDGYLTKRQAGYFYGKENNGNWSYPFNFDYLGVKTSEGVGGVYHVLFYGQYVPESWLYDSWMDILGVSYLAHQSVDIRCCKNETYDIDKLSSYCVNQYVAGQSGYERFNCSNGWICKGFFKRCKEEKSHLNQWLREFSNGCFRINEGNVCFGCNRIRDCYRFNDGQLEEMLIDAYWKQDFIENFGYGGIIGV